MKRVFGIWAIGALVLAASSTAQAQYQGQKPAAVTMYGNAAMNPYLNPMNPYAMGVMPNSPDFLLYMYAGNQANGGLGSGVISGTRPAPGANAGSQLPQQQMGTMNPYAAQQAMNRRGLTPKSSNASPRGSKPALMPVASAIPGSGAAHYFNGAVNGANGAARYYNRPTGRFQNNGRE